MIGVPLIIPVLITQVSFFKELRITLEDCEYRRNEKEFFIVLILTSINTEHYVSSRTTCT